MAATFCQFPANFRFCGALGLAPQKPPGFCTGTP